MLPFANRAFKPLVFGPDGKNASVFIEKLQDHYSGEPRRLSFFYLMSFAISWINPFLFLIKILLT